jgi:regulator of protease activity HflC (stomatin/prohibitin superfamily)
VFRVSNDELIAGVISVGIIGVVAYVIITLLLLALGSNTLSVGVIVPAGNVGVADTLGSVDQNTWGPGVHLKFPLITSVTMFPTKTQAMEINSNAAEGTGGAPTLTSDGMKVEIDLTLQYHVDPAKAMEL